MKYDLAAMARRAGRKRVSNFATPKPTQIIENELAVIYIAVIREWVKQYKERIGPAYAGSLEALIARDGLTRDDANRIDIEIGQSDNFITRLLLVITPRIRNWVVRVEKWHRNKFKTAAKTATSVDLDTVIGPESQQETMEAVLKRNVALIKSVSDDTRKRIEDIVWRGYTSRTPLRAVAKEIDAAVQISRARALRIASDQTIKLASKLDEERMREAGIDLWEWVHSGKVHFRPEHKARDGNRYKWSDNDLGGDLPGIAINCGCKAKAVLEF